MKKILPLALFCVSFFGFSQCPTTELLLETQADIDNFAANYPNCTVLTNDLRIGEVNGNVTNLDGLSLITSAQNIHLRHTQISDFSGLHNLEEVLILSTEFSNNIQNLDGLTSLRTMDLLQIFFSDNIMDLSGMNSIEAIQNVHIFSNPSLTDISQLSFLETINSMNITNNALASLSGLENIHTIYEDLSITNESLINLNELSSLQSIGGSLEITNNMFLNDITVFSNIESLEELYIIRCPSLANFSGLESIQNISGRLRVGFNPSLTDMSIFSNLNSVGNFDIYDNDNLVSLSGLENLQVVSNRLFLSRNLSLISIDAINDLSFSQVSEIAVVNNTSLSVCNSLFMCSVIAVPGVVKSVFNNSIGCNTLEEIEDSCALSVTDSFLNQAVAIYPNPVSEVLKVDVSEEIVLESIVVSSLLGQQLIISTDGFVNFSSFSQGVYFVEITTDQGSITKKVLKR